MARDRADDNHKHLSSDEVREIIERYEAGEIDEVELAEAIGNASMDTNATDDFSDPFFKKYLDIDPSKITEESIQQDIDFRSDENIDDSTDSVKSGRYSKKSVGSGTGRTSKPQNASKRTHKSAPEKDITQDEGKDIENEEDNRGYAPENDYSTPTTSESKKASVPRSPFADPVAELKKPNKVNGASGKRVNKIIIDPEDQSGFEDIEIDVTEDSQGLDGVPNVDDTDATSGPTQDIEVESIPSPFDGEVLLDNSDKSKVTPSKQPKTSPTSPFAKETIDTKSQDRRRGTKKKRVSEEPIVGDASGLGALVKDSNIAPKGKQPNLWKDRYAGIIANEEERRKEQYEYHDNQTQQGSQQNIGIPSQRKKKRGRKLATLAAVLAFLMLLPLFSLVGTLGGGQATLTSGSCVDGITTDDINGTGVRGVPEGSKSNPEIMPPGRNTSGFGPRWGTMHKGIDFATGGSNVGLYAYYDGVVSVVCKDCNPGGFGSYVIIDHKDEDGKPFTTLYGHMFAKDIKVSEGDTVMAGQLIAYEGYNGGVEPPGPGGQHLHFEIAPGASGSGHFAAQVDPMPYLKDAVNPSPDGKGSDAATSASGVGSLSLLPRAKADEDESKKEEETTDEHHSGEENSDSKDGEKDGDEKDQKKDKKNTSKEVCCSGGDGQKNDSGTRNPNSEDSATNLSAHMAENAETIAAVMDELGMGGDRDALFIAYVTALGESNLQMIANDGRQAHLCTGSNQPNLSQAEIAETLNYPHVGEHSPLAVAGIYQQTLRWWGTTEDIMEPSYQAAQFLTEMKKKVPDYKTAHWLKGVTVTQVQEIWVEGKAPESYNTYHVYATQLDTAEKLVDKYLNNHRKLDDKEKKLVAKGKANRSGDGSGSTDSSSSGSDSKNNANDKCIASGSNSNGPLPKNAQERVERVIEEGRKMRAKNLPYGFGANDPDSSMDCSAFISYIWNKGAGIKLGRSTVAMMSNFEKIGGLKVDKKDVQPGDLMLWSGHVAMVTEKDTRMEAGDPVGSESPLSESNIGQEFYGYYRVAELPEKMEEKGLTYDDLEVSGIKG